MFNLFQFIADIVSRAEVVSDDFERVFLFRYNPDGFFQRGSGRAAKRYAFWYNGDKLVDVAKKGKIEYGFIGIIGLNGYSLG